MEATADRKTSPAPAGVPAEAAAIIDARRQSAAAARAAEEAAEQTAADVAALLDAGIVLNGQKWLPVRRPTFQQQWIRAQIVARAGVLPVVQRFNRDTDDANQFAADVMATAFANSALFDLLAALLVKDGATWTVDTIADNALAFASLTDPNDYAALVDCVLWLVLDFFTSLGPSLGTFLKSLRTPAMSGAANSSSTNAARNQNRRPVTSENAAGSAATSISAFGTVKSAP